MLLHLLHTNNTLGFFPSSCPMLSCLQSVLSCQNKGIKLLLKEKIFVTYKNESINVDMNRYMS